MLNKIKVTLGCAFALSLAAVATAQGKLESISSNFKGETPGVTLNGDGLGEPRVVRANGDKTWKFIFPGHLKGKAGYKSIKQAGLRYYTFGWQNSKPAEVFVCFYFSEASEPTAVKTVDGWQIVWGEGAEKAVASNKIAKPAPAANEPEPAVELKPVKTEPTPPITTAKAAAPKSDSNPQKIAVPPGAKIAANTGSFAAPANQVPANFTRTIVPGESGIAAPPKTVDPMQLKVTLTFVNADVVQILRALAQQAEVNIVTSPEVAGKLTVSMNKVTVQSALDIITSMTGLRYAQLGNAFIVTSNGKFAAAVQQIKSGGDSPSETRVVNLMSGEGNQIKLAVFKAIPQDTMDGHYDVVLPSEKVAIAQTQNQASADVSIGGDTGGKGGSQSAGTTGGKQGEAATALQSVSNDTGGSTQADKDPYLVLVGTSDRLNEVETMVRDLDAKIVRAARLGITANIAARVVPIYSMQAFRIREAVNALVERDPNKDSFNIIETQTTPVPGMPASMTMLMISGPMESIDVVANFAKAFDMGICEANNILYPRSPEEAQQSYEVVELKFVEPFEAAYEVQQRIHGLRATLMPAPADPLLAGNTFRRKKDPELWERTSPKGQRVFGDGGVQASSSVTNKSGGEGGGDGGGGGAQGGGGSSGGGSKSGNITNGQQGASAVSHEMGYEPMKILLQGTAQQIAAAKALISIMDVAPKQIAIEVRVASLTKEEALRMGLDWSLLTGGTVRTLRFNNGSGDTSATPGNISGTIGWAGGGSSDILATLDQLAGSGKLLARPNLLAINGKPTSLFVGDRIQYIKTIQASQNGTTIEVGELNVGVELNVVARVGAEKNLTLDLNPSLSILKGFSPVPGGGNLPQTSERYAQSQVVMKSGETIAIGGLMQEEERSSKAGVPILSQIPIVGSLFSRTDKSKIRSEIVFFLTAREVSADERSSSANPTNIKG